MFVYSIVDQGLVHQLATSRGLLAGKCPTPLR